MRIYIDEAGPFVTPTSQNHQYSVVLALILPSALEAELFYEFLRLRDGWSNNTVEVKGSKLAEAQVAQVIELLARFDVLVEFVGLDMATHDGKVLDEFRERQATAITAGLTSAHPSSLVRGLQVLASSVRDMPNQLFAQAYVTIELILEVIEESTLWFAQRLPEELGDIAWIVDAKDRELTEMERTWTTLILPMGESHFARRGLKTLEGADYSHFARYESDPNNAKTKRHIEWMAKAYGSVTLGDDLRSIDGRRLLTDKSFTDSRDSLGLQLADVLATTLRRALNDRLQFAGWKNLGRLLVRKSKSRFIQFGHANWSPSRMQGHASMVWRKLNASSKSMLRA